MTGTQMYNMLKQVLGGEGINQTYALQLFNLARIQYEAKRPWQVLKKLNTSVVLNSSMDYTTPLPIPSDIQRYLSEGAIQLFIAPNNIQVLTETPVEFILNFKNDNNKFAPDYGNGVFYVMGKITQNWTVYQWYIMNTPDITLATSWERFPARFHAILVFNAAARWRLGTDYDDVNARNADDNEQMAEGIYSAMSDWDAELAIGTVNTLNYAAKNSPGIVVGPGGGVGDWRNPNG